ncbi:MAG: hypothetical protein IKB88_11590 [Clostridia bacterium]|nr:hypothetical protein [Clostridia bacterium]
MVKLFEIPIYALSKGSLSKRYNRTVEKIKNKYPEADQESLSKTVEFLTYPQRLWEHNHVVGYIDIISEKQDIVFEIYLPYPKVERYHWNSKNRIFLYNVMANGTRFYVDKNISNSEIQTKIFEMLDWIIKDLIPKRYYVDRATFDAVNMHVDYLGIIK